MYTCVPFACVINVPYMYPVTCYTFYICTVHVVFLSYFESCLFPVCTFYMYFTFILPLFCKACTYLRLLFLRLIDCPHDGCGVLLADPAQVAPRLRYDHTREEELPQSAERGVGH